MNPYITQLSKELSDYQAKYGKEMPDSMVDFLWQCYSSFNPIDDGQIETAEKALTPIFQELSTENSNTLFDLIDDLCLAYQRSAFLEGLLAGFQLCSELTCLP